jgi:hypothetical protein
MIRAEYPRQFSASVKFNHSEYFGGFWPEKNAPKRCKKWQWLAA